VRKYESSSTVLLYEKLKNEKRKKIIYMPTFRDKDAYYLDKAIPDWELLNKECKKNGIVLYVKVHRVTPLPEISDYSNISIINNKIDIYPLLPFFDRMITDYSSIMFDFSLLGKSIVLYIYDYEEYISNSRPLYNHFKELIATLTSVNSFEKLLNVLNVSDHEIKRFPSEKYFERPQTFNIVQNLIKQLEVRQLSWLKLINITLYLI
jgi:CDP-glycerol glycerophosphotransferase (TagB/SpsB family)